MATIIRSILSADNPYYATFGVVRDEAVAVWVDEMIYTYSRSVCAIGYGTDVPISVVSGNGEYRINSGEWTAEAGTFSGGDFIFARLPTPTREAVEVVTTFSIDGVADTFKVSTVGWVADNVVLTPSGDALLTPSGDDVPLPGPL